MSRIIISKLYSEPCDEKVTNLYVSTAKIFFAFLRTTRWISLFITFNRKTLGNFPSAPPYISWHFRTIGGEEDEESSANRERNKERAERREKSPKSTRETRGGEWEKVNVIAVIFGRWLLPGSFLLLLLGSNPLPSSSSYGNIHLFFLIFLFVLSFSLAFSPVCISL